MKFENPHASVIDDIESRVDSVVSENEALKARLESQALLSVEARGLANRKTSGLASAEEAASATKAIATRVYERLTPTEQAAYNIDDLCKFFQRHDYSMALANVGTNFISRAKGSPLIGCFQDTLASIVELTHTGVSVTRYNAMQMFKNIPVVFEKSMHSGRELVSKLLPPINFRTTSLFYNKAYAPYLKYNHDEIEVVIERGHLIKGIMDHKSCGQERSKSMETKWLPLCSKCLLYLVSFVRMSAVEPIKVKAAKGKGGLVKSDK